MEDSVPESTPSSIGPYEVIGMLGVGGMAVVYKVKSREGKIFALKIIHYKEAADPESWKRFRREISLLSQMDHPNIMRIYDVGEWQRRPYFVMDYLEGTTLDKYLAEKERLDEREALQIIYKIAVALEAVHKLEVLHRDIKPSNIFLVQKKPYLMDFGIGCYYTGGSRITRTGTIIGTPNYMSPEQAQGEWEKMGPWSDVYSLGATLHHLLTGAIPFKGKSDIDVIINLNHKSLRPASKYNPSIAQATDVLIQKAMEKDPGARQQSAEEFAEEIRCVLQAKKGPRASGKRSPSLLFLVLLIAIAIGIATAWVILVPADKPHPEKKARTDKKSKPVEGPDNRQDLGEDPSRPPDHGPPPVLRREEWPTDAQLGLQDLPETRQKIQSLEQETKNSDAVDKLRELARLHEEVANFRTAVDVLQRIPPSHKSLEILWEIAQDAGKAGMYIHAKFYLELLEDRFPEHPHRQKAAEMLAGINGHFKKIISAPGARENVYKLLICLSMAHISGVERQFTRRAQYLAQTLNISQDNIEEFIPWVRILRALDYISAGDCVRARQEIDLARDDNQKLQQGQKKLWSADLEIFFVQGICFFFVGEYGQAQSIFSQIQRVPSVDQDLLREVNVYLEALQKPQGHAEFLVERLQQQMDVLAGLLMIRAFAANRQFVAQGNFQQSLATLTEFLLLEGQWYHLVHHHLGSCRTNMAALAKDRMRVEHIRYAVVHYTHARMLSPGFNDPVFFLGQLADRLGDRAQAEKYFRYCRQHPPKWVDGAAEYLEEFFSRKNG